MENVAQTRKNTNGMHRRINFYGWRDHRVKIVFNSEDEYANLMGDGEAVPGAVKVCPTVEEVPSTTTSLDLSMKIVPIYEEITAVSGSVNIMCVLKKDLISGFQHLIDVNQQQHDAVAKTQLDNQIALCSNELVVPWNEQLLNRTYAAFCEEVERMKIENFYDNWIKKTIIVISKALNNGVVEDIPVLNIMICGKIVSVALCFGFKWILIEDQNKQRVLCRLDIPKQVPESQENKLSVQYYSTRDVILIKAMESRVKDLEIKLNQLFVDSKENLLGRKVMVKGGMYAVKGEKMILVKKCWYVNEMEEFYFHKMAVNGKKNWLLERESSVRELGSNYLKNVYYDMT